MGRKGTLLALIAAAALAPAPAIADKGHGHGHWHGKYKPGARSIGDTLFPQVGNGGYDALHYAINLDYNPVSNAFRGGTSTTITARATQNLSRFSLDFQDLAVSKVTVNGDKAKFKQVLAQPPLTDNPVVTQLRKLLVKPKQGLKKGRVFTVKVSYSGVPPVMTDADETYEGWVPACHTVGFVPPCDGAFVVNEPNGAQTWYPANNTPRDKASFDTTITVPNASTALGVGELASKQNNGDGTSTWRWSEDDPTATYLTTATVGDFDYSVTPMTETSTGRTLPVYNAIDSSYNATQKANVNATLALAPGMLNFISSHYGPYPFDSTGAVIDRAPDVGYALEVQTKSHFARLGTTSNDISDSTLLHEISHQWFGDSVSPTEWLDVWFNEGWATYSEWIWGNEVNGGDSPQAIFDDNYANLPDDFWAVAPAVLNNDPSLLFSDVVYDRGAMVIEGTREIIGDAKFGNLIHALIAGHEHGNITTRGFIALAEQISGFSGAKLNQLADFYEQWLYGEQKPTILPSDFGP
jgi:aminopeptidase N